MHMNEWAPVQTSDLQPLDGTNLRLTSIGQNKCQTSTNVGLVQMLDWYNKRWTVPTYDQYKCQTSTKFNQQKKMYLNFKIFFIQKLFNFIE